MSAEAAVLDVVDRFFAAFTSGAGLDERLDDLRSIFLPGAVVLRTCGGLTTYDVDGFIEPRRSLLASGRLSDFGEWRTEGRVDVFGDVAHWFGRYAKAWQEDGATQRGGGMKSIQLVRTAAGWRISAAAWDDDPPVPD